MTRVAAPAVTTAQMAEVDRRMSEEYGILLIQMMENAGRNLAELARRLLGGGLSGRNVAVLCGPGNNGGGGMVGARHLHNRGATVEVAFAGDVARLADIPAHQWRILQTMGLAGGRPPDLTGADLIVDALLGYGLTGDPREPVRTWIDRANGAGRPILSLDAPSGLDTTTGVPARPCVRAAATLTLALPKTGLRARSALPFVGDLYLGDISVPPELYKGLGMEVGPLFEDDTIVAVT